MVYAENGDYTEAEFLIKKAIHTNSSYSVAQKNLTEIYAREASRAYSKALELKQDNDPVFSKKLVLISEFSSLKKSRTPNKIEKPNKKTSAKNTRRPQSSSANEINIESSGIAPKKQNKITKSKIPPGRDKVIAKTKKISNKKSTLIIKDDMKYSGNIASEAKKEQKLIIETIKGWAKNWSSQNVGQYFSYYSRNFSPPGLSRAIWEETRILRLSKPRFIKIEIDNILILSIDGKKAKVKFTQSYESDTYKDRTIKILSLEKNQDYWWIIGEKETNK